MRAYRAILSARFRELLQYRVSAVAGIITQIVFGWIMVMVYQAFYATSNRPQPMELGQVITYVWLGQAFLGIAPWNVDGGIAELIRSGNVAYELVRPVDLYNVWFVRCLARRTAPTLLRSVPLLVLAGAFFGMKAPASLGSTAAFVAAMVGAVLLSAAMTTLTSTSLLWTVAGTGAYRLVPAAVIIFSGMEIPLPFLPEFLHPIVYALPFRGLADIPYRLYTGHIAPQDAPALLAHQLVWVAVLVAAGRWLLAVGKRRVVVQGG